MILETITEDTFIIVSHIFSLTKPLGEIRNDILKDGALKWNMERIVLEIRLLTPLETILHFYVKS